MLPSVSMVVQLIWCVVDHQKVSDRHLLTGFNSLGKNICLWSGRTSREQNYMVTQADVNCRTVDKSQCLVTGLVWNWMRWTLFHPVSHFSVFGSFCLCSLTTLPDFWLCVWWSTHHCLECLTLSFVWFQCVLHYMVRSKEAVGGVSREVVDVLLHAGLIKK